jgi:hypothetical protein
MRPDYVVFKTGDEFSTRGSRGPAASRLNFSLDRFGRGELARGGSVRRMPAKRAAHAG